MLTHCYVASARLGAVPSSASRSGTSFNLRHICVHRRVLFQVGKLKTLQLETLELSMQLHGVICTGRNERSLGYQKEQIIKRIESLSQELVEFLPPV